MVLLIAFLFSPLPAKVFGVSPASSDLPLLKWSLIGMMLTWIVLQLPVGLLGRGLTSVGHYAATVWWYLANGIMQAVIPALAVAFGANLAGAAIAYIVATAVTQILCAFHYRWLARREELHVRRPHVGAGLRRMMGGLALGASSFLDFLQQTGFRLALLPFLGAVRLVQFSTMRTVANVVQQGLVVLVNPVIPELIRYVAARDRLRTSMTTTAMFYITVVLMCPGFVALQAIVRPMFAIWTQGKVSFDEPVFAALSCAVLITGLTQASRAIVRGNNLVVAQGVVSLLTGIGLLVITFLSVRSLGLLGAALGLVGAEALRATLFTVLAVRWFYREDFVYPRWAATTAIGCTVATMLVLTAMAMLPNAEILIALLYLPAWLAMNTLFWLALSPEEREFAVAVIGRYLPRRYAYPAREI
jgi:O-antigen/teichoic acid export membrane protein